MPNRKKQFEDVCLYGITGAILNGDFVVDGSGEETIPNMYIRQNLALTKMMVGGGDNVTFDYATGLPVEVTNRPMNAYWRCMYKLPITPEDGEVVVKFQLPEYIQGQHAGSIYLSGANYDTVEHSPVTGNTAAYLDEACTQYLVWNNDPDYGDYFIAPKVLYFKMKAGTGGSVPWEYGETTYDYSLLNFDIQYNAKDTEQIYQ